MADPSENLIISLVQADIAWEKKAANLQLFEAKIMTHTDKMEVVVLPEMFSTGFVMQPEHLAESMDGETVSWMKRIAMQKKIILTGSVIIREADNYFNRLIWMLPNGTFGYYDKRHLFAYAGEDETYTPGTKRLIASVKGWRVNLLVCYDLRFPVWARQTVPVDSLPDGGFAKSVSMETRPEYDVLIYVANWPVKRSHAWKTLLQARAIENQCYVAGNNRIGVDGVGLEYNGDSMVVSPMGEILTTVEKKPEVITYELSYSKLNEVRTKLPFLKDADPFIIGR